MGLDYQRLHVILCLGLNVASSIAIVVINKWIFQEHQFSASTTLTLIHFVMTFVGLLLCMGLGLFKFKRLDVRQVIPLSASFCGFVLLTNLSLLYNNVGFYQLAKVLTTPLLVLMESLIYKKTFSPMVKLSLLVICIGVAIATVTDADVNAPGLLVAASALVVTCQYQIWVGTKQKELECNSCQLLLYQAPLSSLMLLPIALYLNEFSYMAYFCWATVRLILLSGVVAFLVNISIFLVIGKTSPVTYNVLGHFKLCVILFMGYMYFADEMNKEKVVGIVITLVGVFWYTHLRATAQVVEEERKAKLDAEENSAVSRKNFTCDSTKQGDVH